MEDFEDAILAVVAIVFACGLVTLLASLYATLHP